MVAANELSRFRTGPSDAARNLIPQRLRAHLSHAEENSVSTRVHETANARPNVLSLTYCDVGPTR